MKKSMIVVASLLVLMMSGCGKTGNLFSFTHKAGSDTADAIVLNADAQSAYASGDYAKAEELALKSIQADPRNSTARQLYVQSYIRNSGLDLIALAQNATNQKSIALLTPGFFSPAPSTDGYWLIPKDPTAQYGITLARLEGIYQVIIEHFTPIINGETDMAAADVPSIIFVNRAFAYLLRGAIRVADKDLNGSVDYLVWHDNISGDNWVYDDDEVTRITSTDGIITVAEETASLADLDAAIADLTSARDRSLSTQASIWQSAIDMLNEVKDMINNLL